MPYKNLIFDFDGTLADSSMCGIKATQAAFVELGYIAPNQQTIDYYMGIPIEQSFKKMLSCSISDENFSKLLALFRHHYAELENDYLIAFDGVKETLQQLVNNGCQLFILSSKKTVVLHRNLAKLGIDTFFTEVVGSDKVSAYKPDPSGIHHLIAQFQLNPAETIMIGDTIFDIQMGKNASIDTAAVTWGAHSNKQLQTENPTFLIHYMSECLTL